MNQNFLFRSQQNFSFRPQQTIWFIPSPEQSLFRGIKFRPQQIFIHSVPNKFFYSCPQQNLFMSVPIQKFFIPSPTKLGLFRLQSKFLFIPSPTKFFIPSPIKITCSSPVPTQNFSFRPNKIFYSVLLTKFCSFRARIILRNYLFIFRPLQNFCSFRPQQNLC